MKWLLGAIRANIKLIKTDYNHNQITGIMKQILGV